MTECKSYDIFCWLGWLVDEIKLVFVGLYASILDSLTNLFSAIPTPDFLLGVVPSLPQSVVFFANLFMVHYGMGIVVSAYLLRFLVRRLPIIG